MSSLDQISGVKNVLKKELLVTVIKTIVGRYEHFKDYRALRPVLLVEPENMIISFQ